MSGVKRIFFPASLDMLRWRVAACQVSINLSATPRQARQAPLKMTINSHQPH